MKAITTVIIFTMSLFFTTSCKKDISTISKKDTSSCEKLVDTTWMYYDETYCADPWGQNNIQENEKKKNIKDYFKKEKGIKVFKVKFLGDRTRDSCFSCLCKSGKRIKAKIKESDIKVMKTEGFYQ